MENLSLAETIQTPKIFFDLKEGKLQIEGKSYADDINEPFKELFEYIEHYSKAPKKVTVIEFKWLYFNTATAKIIVKLVLQLKRISELKVIWYCKNEFVMMQKKGEEFKTALEIDLEIVDY